MEQTTASDSKRGEHINLAILFVLIMLLLKIVFYNETVSTIFTTSAGLFWLFIIPGYCLTFVWKNESTFFERFLIGIPISAATIGITSYYLGLAGLNLSIHTWLLPTLILIVTIIITLKRKTSS